MKLEKGLHYTRWYFWANLILQRLSADSDQSLGFEQQYGDMAEVEVDEVLRF